MRKSASALAGHRARKASQGYVRVEVNVRKEDAALVRHIASALSDPAPDNATRAMLRQSVASARKADLKALLACAPLEGIDLTRSADTGRDIEL
jgi:hypothetical protein